MRRAINDRPYGLRLRLFAKLLMASGSAAAAAHQGHSLGITDKGHDFFNGFLLSNDHKYSFSFRIRLIRELLLWA